MKKASRNLLLTVMTTLPLAVSAQSHVAIEAEVGLITPPFVVTNGYVFQGLQTNLAGSGRAVFDINISQPGGYVILAAVSSPNEASSLAVNIDGEPVAPTMIWDIPASQEFTVRTVTWRDEGAATNTVMPRKVFNLTPGPHQVIIRGGDASGARLDRFSVARIPTPPGGLRVVANP